jgi:hypothetical protein
MQHLTLEDIARLVDEPGTPGEAAHVASCLVCRRELDEMRAQTRLLGSLDDPEPAPEVWFAVEKALRAERLIRDEPVRPAARLAGRGWIRIAAGVALFITGAAAGVYLRGHPAQRVAQRPETVRGAPVIVTPPRGDGGQFVSAEPAPDVDMGGPMVVEPVASGNGVRLASSGPSPSPMPAPPPPRSRPRALSPEAASAERELVNAEAGYVAALQRYASIADPQSGADAATRMAALERMIRSTGSALESAPDDPVINGYHLAALRERDALRQQMANSEKDWF